LGTTEKLIILVPLRQASESANAGLPTKVKINGRTRFIDPQSSLQSINNIGLMQCLSYISGKIERISGQKWQTGK
jgi:hypothetical protein